MKPKFEVLYNLDSIQETATNLLNFFESYRIFCFFGNLGNGKTTFISFLCKSLGSMDSIHSPTFSLINEYDSEKGTIYHFDLYILKNTEEAMDIGFEEYLYSNNFCFIEWPEKVTDILPNNLVVNCTN